MRHFRLFQTDRNCGQLFEMKEIYSKQVENTVGKGAISPFPTVFLAHLST